MKTKILFLGMIAFLAGLNISLAQPWTVKWSYTGDNVTAANYVGTNNAVPLNFKSNSLQRMTPKRSEPPFWAFPNTSIMTPFVKWPAGFAIKPHDH